MGMEKGSNLIIYFIRDCDAGVAGVTGTAKMERYGKGLATGMYHVLKAHKVPYCNITDDSGGKY